MRRALPIVAALGMGGAGFIAACADDPEPTITERDSGADTSRADSPHAPIEDAPPDDEDGDADAGPPVFLPPVTCGDELPGPPMTNGIENQPGFASELEAVDAAGVPDPLAFASESRLIRGVINFMLGRASGTSFTHAEANDAGVFGRIILAAAAREDGGGIDVPFLRRGLHYAYLCSRPVPHDLAELTARYGDYKRWPGTTIECSRPKNGPRELHVNRDQGVFVAETIADGGDVRETEVLFTSLRDDGQFDFAVYTREGSLTDRSTFATASSEVTSAAPYTCMTCHIEAEAGAFTRLFPSGTGAGCRN